MLKLDLSNVKKEINYLSFNKKIDEFKSWCESQFNSSKGMFGWLKFASQLDCESIKKIKNTAKYIKENFQTLVVVGVGGSYLGTRAIIDALNNDFNAENEIIYLGNTMSARYTKQILDYLKNKRFAVLVVSKSGKTLEPAIAFRFLKELLVKTMGDKFYQAIFAITDETNGALRREVNKMNYTSFVIPSNIGGRYSVFTAVGLLPFAVAGGNIDKFLDGVRQAEKELSVFDNQNLSLRYAMNRFELSKSGKNVELFACYEPQLRFFLEWIKQLFGESEGKNGKGVLPISAIYTTDLHSFGQFIQEGTPCLFETVIKVTNFQVDLTIPQDKNDFDNLNSLCGKEMDFINNTMIDSVVKAHVQGGVDNIVLSISDLDEFNIGYLIYFFMLSCVFSCFLQGVDPFNQPGVEVYKKNAHTLLNIKD